MMMAEMLANPEAENSRRAMDVVMKMKKPDIADGKRAYAGAQGSRGTALSPKPSALFLP